MAESKAGQRKDENFSKLNAQHRNCQNMAESKAGQRKDEKFSKLNAQHRNQLR
jgi:hypothetical protein